MQAGAEKGLLEVLSRKYPERDWRMVDAGDETSDSDEDSNPPAAKGEV